LKYLFGSEGQSKHGVHHALEVLWNELALVVEHFGMSVEVEHCSSPGNGLAKYDDKVQVVEVVILTRMVEISFQVEKSSSLVGLFISRPHSEAYS
jgi:hypothetical protein